MMSIALTVFTEAQRPFPPLDSSLSFLKLRGFAPKTPLMNTLNEVATSNLIDSPDFSREESRGGNGLWATHFDVSIKPLTQPEKKLRWI